MGDVYLAEHVKMHRQVALKVLPSALVDSPFHSQRFYQEFARDGRPLASEHRAGVRRRSRQVTGDHFMAMEYIEGQDCCTSSCSKAGCDRIRAADYSSPGQPWASTTRTIAPA